MNATFDSTGMLVADSTPTETPLMIANVSRRKFLQGASVLGGLVLAVGLPRHCALRARPSTARMACRMADRQPAGVCRHWRGRTSARLPSFEMGQGCAHRHADDRRRRARSRLGTRAQGGPWATKCVTATRH
jgi:hypothetical protein